LDFAEARSGTLQSPHRRLRKRSFKGWLNWPEADGEGLVNLGWPVVWREARPALEAELFGAAGRPYAAAAEFRHMRSKYPFRNLSAVAIHDGS